MICPACHAALAGADRDGAMRCPGCGRTYPSHHGIPDLRLAPDPYLSVERDRQRADLVVAALAERDFPSLLDYYWSLSEETPPALRGRFAAGALRAGLRARHLLDRLAALGVATATSRVLEIGSGTGAFLAEAVPRVGEVVGLDAALRWLHLGRRRLRDAGLAEPPLVCAAGEALPFPDGRFDLVVCVATLEFARDPLRLLSESARVLRPGGALFLNTVNRFSLAAEPHVGLWGVGFLPRAWQARYVRRRGRGDFALRLTSYGELEGWARRHFQRRRIDAASIPDELVARMPGRRRAVAAYRFLQRLPQARGLLRRVAPEWDALLVKE